MSTSKAIRSTNGSSSVVGNKRKEPTPFVPQEGWELISQGAEARLWKIPASHASTMTPRGRKERSEAPNDDQQQQQQHCIAKERFHKRYRHPVLDERLTKQRCRMEGRILEKCSKAGIAVPNVWRVEAPILYMEYIDGTTVRNKLQSWNLDGLREDQKTADADGPAVVVDDAFTRIKGRVAHMGRIIGHIIGRLHGCGIIHGDLTTSNMMIRNEKKEQLINADDDNKDQTILLIDFGLAKHSESAEERAVDLYVLERALSSTHPSLPDTFMDDIILPAYAKVAPKADASIQRLEQVRMRGRKRECFG